MGYAFISYSSKNKDSADALINLLNKNNISSWVAPDDIPVGNKYAQVINKAIKNCACFVLLLNGNSMNSQWVAKEVERAIHYKRFIVPIKTEDVALSDEFELYISTDQILSVAGFNEETPELDRLISTVAAHAQLSDYEKSDLEAELLNDAKYAEALQEDEEPVSDRVKRIFNSKTKKGLRNLLILSGCALALILALFISNALGGKNQKENSGGNDFDAAYSAIESQFANTQEKIQNGMNNEFETSIPEGTNQIPEEYEAEITALMYSDALSLNNKTLVIKEGGYATPQSASVWKGCRILSQDTDIAVGEGLVVHGVSKGETFIIVEAPGGMTSVYYVIVE